MEPQTAEQQMKNKQEERRRRQLTFGLSDGVADFGLDVVHAVVRKDQGQTNTHTQTHKKKTKL